MGSNISCISLDEPIAVAQLINNGVINCYSCETDLQEKDFIMKCLNCETNYCISCEFRRQCVSQGYGKCIKCEEVGYITSQIYSSQI